MSEVNLPVRTQLVDMTNVGQLAEEIQLAMKSADFIGIDTEFQDSARHQGLNIFSKYDEEGEYKSPAGKLVFDMRRAVMTGFSIYPEDWPTAYYFNLNHADVENRLTWEICKAFLDCKKPSAFWLAHNAPVEITIFKSCYNYDLIDIICTLQLCVSAYGPDEYSPQHFMSADLGAMGKWVPLIMAKARAYDPSIKKELPADLADIVNKITAKESKAAHSYNGWVKELAYGYGLKKAVLSWFGHKMSSFEETLDGESHMGKLTGAQAAEYGAEDAYWVVPLFRKVMEFMAHHAPNAINAFFTTENPMIHTFAEIWQEGMKVNFAAIERRRAEERANFANLLRDLRKTLRALLPFPSDYNETLTRKQKWYWDEEKGKGSRDKYRAAIVAWANADDEEDDYEQVCQVSSAVSNAWRAEKRLPKIKGFNPTYYMQVRMMVYDLCGAKPIYDKGELQGDGEARGKMKDNFSKEEGTELKRKLIDLINEMSGLEQRMKMYLTPYMLLTDPETNRMYPVVTCMLATRRMAASVPNPMQLAKRGESTYVRGFFEADDDDHVIVSLDWSAFELVIVGELSKDPEFKKAFGQLPHEDLHAGAAASILQVVVEALTEEIFKSLKRCETWDQFIDETRGVLRDSDVLRLRMNLKGELIEQPRKAFSYWRTEVGKGANFNYWYSGFLATIGERFGWSMDETGRATDKYRDRFHVAERWRVSEIDKLKALGYVELPDGHRRYRYEATDAWMAGFMAKWRTNPFDPSMRGYNAVISEMARRISRRAGNQGINAEVQGTNAFVIKRSRHAIRERMKELGWGPREARFMIPIHDEKVFSVHHELVTDFIDMARPAMMNHDDIFPTLKLDATPAVGLTFEPWNAKKAPGGQVELYEPPEEIVGKERAFKRLDNAGIKDVVGHLMELKRAA